MVRMKRPFNEGDTVVLTPDGLGARGAALADYQGWRVRVYGGLPGEKAHVRIVHVSKGGPVAEAKFLEPAEAPHEGRREVRCPIHARCGGCGLQHATARSMLTAKIEQARGVLGADSAWEDPIESPRAFDYRTKTFFLAKPDGYYLRFGARAAGGKGMVDTRDCDVVAPVLRDVGNSVLDSLGRLSGLTHVLRTVMLRANREEDVQVTLVHHGDPDDSLLAAAEALAVDRVFLQRHDAPGNRIHSEEPEVLVKGDGLLVERYAGDFEALLPATAFCQGNPDVADVLYVEAARALQGERLAEIYCGAGVAGLLALRSSPDAKLLAVDKSPRAIATARANAGRNGLADRCVFEATAAEDLKDVAWDSVLLNPPRAGCHEAVLDTVKRSGASRAVYLSCNPQTLARDVERLGWNVVSVRAADMFPQTPHLELLAVLEP